MSFTDQLILQLYGFMMGPYAKILLGVVLLLLIVWAAGATRKHAYHYAMKGAGFGATSAVITALILIGAFVYMVVDRRMLSEILSGKRPISDVSVLAAATADRFRFVLGASTTVGNGPMSNQDVMNLIEKLPPAEKVKLQVQVCQQVLKDLQH